MFDLKYIASFFVYLSEIFVYHNQFLSLENLLNGGMANSVEDSQQTAPNQDMVWLSKASIAQ